MFQGINFVQLLYGGVWVIAEEEKQNNFVSLRKEKKFFSGMCKVSLVPWSKNYVPGPQVVYCFNASTSMTVQKYLAAYSLHRRVW